MQHVQTEHVLDLNIKYEVDNDTQHDDAIVTCSDGKKIVISALEQLYTHFIFASILRFGGDSAKFTISNATDEL